MERPEVIVNVGSSLDGVIASDKGSLRISTTEDWLRVHELRNEVDAILVGVNTILKDNPLLTVRYLKSKTPYPKRIILDSKCRTPLSSKVLLDLEKYPTVIITSKNTPKEKKEKLEKKGVIVLQVSENKRSNLLDLKEVLDRMKNELNIEKLLVEGGTTVITQFIKQRFVDKMYIFYSPVFAGTKNAKLLYDEQVIENIADTIKFEVDNLEKCEEGFVVTLIPREAEK